MKSAFDKEKLVKHGFNDTYTYFKGTKYRGIGWAGNGSNVSGKYIVGDLSYDPCKEWFKSFAA